MQLRMLPVAEAVDHRRRLDMHGEIVRLLCAAANREVLRLLELRLRWQLVPAHRAAPIGGGVGVAQAKADSVEEERHHVAISTNSELDCEVVVLTLGGHHTPVVLHSLWPHSGFLKLLHRHVLLVCNPLQFTGDGVL